VPLVDSVIAGDSPAWQYADPHAARQLAQRVRQSQGELPEQQQALLRIVLLDRWLRVFNLS
jgi:hypothetical protein